MWGNLPRKFNIAISGSRDDFAHTHINDIGLVPVAHAKTGQMGFNVVLGVSILVLQLLPMIVKPTLSPNVLPKNIMNLGVHVDQACGRKHFS